MWMGTFKRVFPTRLCHPNHGSLSRSECNICQHLSSSGLSLNLSSKCRFDPVLGLSWPFPVVRATSCLQPADCLIPDLFCLGARIGIHNDQRALPDASWILIRFDLGV